MLNTLVSIPGYAISEELYNGSRTLVYRGYQDTDSLPVVIKLLKNPYPSFSELVQFRNQYTIAKNLNSPLIIATYSLETYQNGYALVMEDFGGISLKDYFTRVETRYIVSLQEFLEIAITLCNTLDILYRERIIHKDIKPSNILINLKTKQIKLIDFSIASLLPRETQTLINPNVLEGTLAYISPEQTGRMNRGIDYRTDFYSLGVTFYELLTGVLPFLSNEPMELVHCHIAKVAPLVHEISPEIPPVLSEVVKKLMAKNAEDRYQSALGLKFDLENCLTQLQETGKIGDFEIGRRDVCDRFLIPDKLYGREAEVSTLLQAFERVSQGATEMMLVAGFSGIGKTAVVNEVHKPIVRQRGYFIKGKYDQFNRNIPFSAVVQAFRDLMGQLLSESDSELHIWKTQILQALRDNGQIILEVIPELERIIGKQAPATELSGTAAQNRFNLLFQKFIQVFTTKEHPLVMFLDDLQWADSASLNLMQLLMNESESRYLLMIGAYRDNEVSPAHPLMLTLDAIAKANATINTITLGSLSQCSLNQLVADTLNCHILTAQALTELISLKTKGNPFFATQFLKALYQDGLIQFDFNLGYWQCDLAEIRTVAMSDDVVEFMASQLQKLPSDTQDILKLAACIGAQFDLHTLAIVSQQSESDAAVALWKALQEGLIIPQSEIYKFYMGELDTTQNTQQVSLNYKFLHDRVQQAAYSLIPEEQKQATHLAIGRLLLQNIPDAELEASIFEIVNQLNVGIELLAHPVERDKLAKLNLIAGRKARASAAYELSLKHSSLGIDLLETNAWGNQYDLSYALHIVAAESAYLIGNFERAQQCVEFVLENAKSLIDKIIVYEVSINIYIANERFTEALEISLQVLKNLGIDMPNSPTVTDLEQASSKTTHLIEEKNIEDLIYLPEMTDSYALSAMRLLNLVVVPAYQRSLNSFLLTIYIAVQLSIKYGNSSFSASFYTLYGMVLCSISNDIERGYQFGMLALNLMNQLQDKQFHSRIFTFLLAFIVHWKSHPKNFISFGLTGYQIGLETGDLENTAWNCFHECQTSYLIGQELTELQQKMTIRSAIIRQGKHKLQLDLNEIQRQVILNLMGYSENPCCLIGEAFNEEQAVPQYQVANSIQALHCVYLHKLILCFLFEEYTLILDLATLAANYIGGVLGQAVVPVFHYYDSLARLAVFSKSSEVDQNKILEMVKKNQSKLREWSGYAPMNHLHKFYLVEAEQHHVLGNRTEAMDYYDRAISGAKENEYIQEEALANELAAKFYLNWGKEKVAAGYMQEAYYCYAHWGAKAKVADLEKRYPQLLAPILQNNRSSLSSNETIFALGSVTSTSYPTSSNSVSVALDLATILKASQTISGEIELEKLLSSLLSIIIENAGADKCVLMLMESGNLMIRALALVGVQNEILTNPKSVAESRYLPVGLINTVKRSLQSAVIVDARVHSQLINDSYIQQQQPKSILCSPILHQGKLLGVLYLENNLATGAFTSDRIELLNLLCAQAAISLENAQLYEHSQQYAKQLEESFAQLSASNSRFEKLVDNVPGVVYQYQISADGVISLPYISADCYEIYEITAEQAIANVQFLLKAIHPDDAANHQQSVADSMQTLTPFEWSGRIVTASGIVKWIHIEARIQKLADGTLVWDGLVLDISERKEAELALQQKSLALENALNDLQQAQLQIVQSEKMSALGNLVAGVAHEINNPVGCIIGNVSAIQDYINDLFGLIDLYNDKFPQPGTEIAEELETIDLEYLRDDLPKLIRAMKDAGDRITSISHSLRTFSRADSDQKQTFNLHEGIDSTILILRHRLKASETRPAIEVVTNYGNLPQVECFPGQLNQVFMNILANAIDALEESNQGRSFEQIKTNPNRITITTSVENHLVKIAIADNGKGISESVKQKIFDHLFTTKAVGKGTGLGLAIAQQIIVEKHNGSLKVNSTLGEGTEFVITLPILAPTLG
ncbi:AAA family ATPase [Nostoc sp. KVJ3]|uniref:trifunctional serine/threonine-protein kinase/ATP-binding protein/sensor histidine kinase n=1 Tax=Nostoc sp. KVJ3 TaxID=457945 RepID=UPI00223811F6|nr:AAA family ATPase [Nostoc sp. KVJ3]MCW5318453.1 AAA family ATPase [Nostoc sp. KVJ3]